MKDIQNFYNHEAKMYKQISKTYKIINGLIQSFDGVLLLGVSSTAITLSIKKHDYFFFYENGTFFIEK